MLTPTLETFIAESIDKLKAESRYRYFRNLQREENSLPYAIDKNTQQEITVWCSNDYLGLSQNQNVKLAMHKAIDTYGAGSGGTRNISGSHSLINQLEETVAQLHNKEAGLAFTSGYVANESTLAVLGKIIPDLVIFSDALNHASIINGIKKSDCKKEVFRHNDMAHLESQLKNYNIDQPKIIVFESVYSMDGDFGKVEDIVALAKKYNALTYIDEVHGVGIYGDNGAGLTEQWRLQNEIDIIQANFAKGFGVFGGYIAATKTLIDAIRSYASGFIFTTSLPPVVCAGAIASINECRKNKGLRVSLHKTVAKVKNKFDEYGVKYLDTASHIILVMVNNAEKCKQATDHLLDKHQIYIQPINYPTVPKNAERLRITPTPYHSDEDIEKLAAALKDTLIQFSQ